MVPESSDRAGKDMTIGFILAHSSLMETRARDDFQIKCQINPWNSPGSRVMRAKMVDTLQEKLGYVMDGKHKRWQVFWSLLTWTDWLVADLGCYQPMKQDMRQVELKEKLYWDENSKLQLQRTWNKKINETKEKKTMNSTSGTKIDRSSRQPHEKWRHQY